MIKSFKSKEAEKIYQGRYSKRIPRDIQRLAARKLEMLAAASELKSLRIPPSNRLEKLKGDRAVNTVFESTINGVFVLYGKPVMPMRWRSLIITRGRSYG